MIFEAHDEPLISVNMLGAAQKVIPGQYITPIYKLDEEGNIERFLPGKGAYVAEIGSQKSQKKLPVVVATVLGKVHYKKLTSVEPKDERESIDNKNVTNYLVSISPREYDDDDTNVEENMDGTKDLLRLISINLPQEKDIVLVKIIRLNSKQAFSEILAVEGRGNILKDSGLGANGENAHDSIPPGGGTQSLSSYEAIASHSAAINAMASDLGESFRGIIRAQDVRLTDKDKVKIIDCFRPGDIVRAEIISLGDGSNYYLSTARNDLGVVFARSDGGAGGLMYAMDWKTMICPTTGTLENRKCAKPFI